MKANETAQEGGQVMSFSIQFHYKAGGGDAEEMLGGGKAKGCVQRWNRHSAESRKLS